MIDSCRGLLPVMVCVLFLGYGCGNIDPVEINAICTCDDDCVSTHFCSSEGLCQLRTYSYTDGDLDRRADNGTDMPDSIDGIADAPAADGDADMDMDNDHFVADYVIEAGDEIEWTDDCPLLPDDYISEDFTDHAPLCKQIVCYYIGAPQCWTCSTEPDYRQEGDPCHLAFDIWGRCIDGMCDLRDYPTCSTPHDCEDLDWHKNCHGHWGCVEGLCTQICDD